MRGSGTCVNVANTEPAIPRYFLTQEYDIPRVILGCWQLAGGHGTIPDEDAFRFWSDALDKGFDTFDCADIYTGVEERLGRFIHHLQTESGGWETPNIQIHTKFVPDLDAIRNHEVTDEYVRAICERSLVRLGVPSLDLVQFHWWDYDEPGMVRAAQALKALQGEGKIKNIGVTNFDVPHLEMLLDAGIPVVSNQVQYSVLDSRPENGMTKFADQHGISLLCYGAVSGGFLSEKYLGINPPEEHENRSLTKYHLMIEERGGWEIFQNLLRTLKEIGSAHDIGIAEVAARYVLESPSVAAVIIGTRSGAHLEENRRVFSFSLTPSDYEKINDALREMAPLEGDIYSFERNREGKHGAIMKYNNNR